MGVKEWLVNKLDLQKRANPVVGADLMPSERTYGVGGDWAPLTYGEYYPRSVPIYAAIKIRQDAIARVPLRVMRTSNRKGKVVKEPVEPMHTAQLLLDRVNPFWTRGDLWRATETYMNLWGSAYWALERGVRGEITEIWALRSDKMRIIPDPETYIKGFVYMPSATKMIPFLPEDMIWMRYFNPMDEYAGLSPIAPLRMSADMGLDALRANRSTLINDSTPGLIIQTKTKPGDAQVKEFYLRWESRHKGVDKVKRPAILGEGMEAKNMGFSPRDMEFIQSLRWTVEDVARVYNIPKPMLHDLERATYENIRIARRSLWEDCIVPQLMFYQERLQEMLLPHFSDKRLLVEFDTSQVEALQEDETEKANRRQIYLGSGVVTINEVRSDMGMAPVAWGDEDPRPSQGSFSASFGPEPRYVQQVGRNGHRALLAIRALAGGAWEDAGERAEQAFVENLDPLEQDFHGLMVDLFNSQVDEMLDRLDEHRSVHPMRDDAGVVADLIVAVAEYERNVKIIRADPPDVAPTGGLRLFDPEDWMPIFARLGQPFIERAVVAGAVSQVTQFGLGISFDVGAPLTQRWIKDRLLFWADRVNRATAGQVVEAIKAANVVGESIPQIAERLEHIREVNTRARAFTIARTEMVGAQNEGHQQAYEQAEVPGKQWFTAQDERVREAHFNAHGQIRKVREDFDVGGEKLRTPGQGGSAGNVINCRCVQLPVLAE